MQSRGMYDAAYTRVSENEQKANRLLQQTATNLQEKQVRWKAWVGKFKAVGMAVLMSSAASASIARESAGDDAQERDGNSLVQTGMAISTRGGAIESFTLYVD